MDIQTLGEVKSFITRKVSGEEGADANNKKSDSLKSYDRDAITIALPQNQPFLFIDSAEIDGKKVTAKYEITGDEYFLEGHFSK